MTDIQLDKELQALLDATRPLAEIDQEAFAADVRALEKDPAFIADLNKGRFIESVLVAMEAQSINKSQLADRWGKSRQYVSKVLNEDRRVNFTLESMAEICVLLGLTLDVRALQPSESATVLSTIHCAAPAEPAPLRDFAAYQPTDTPTEVFDEACLSA